MSAVAEVHNFAGFMVGGTRGWWDTIRDPLQGELKGAPLTTLR